MALLPKVKLKAMLSFPSAILDGAGVDVTRVNGAFRFDLAFEDFAPPISGIADPANTNALLWNSATDTYVLAPVNILGSAGTVPEAPNDGTQYGRQSHSWTPISTGSTVLPSTTTPIMDGTGAQGTSALYSRGDHVHPSDTSRALTTHSHVAANVTDFSEAVDDRVAGLLVAGSNVTLTYDDPGNALTIASTAPGVADGDKGDITVSGSGITWTIDPNTVSNAKLAQMPLFTIKANNTGFSAVPTDINIASLTTKTPAGADYLLLSDTSASGALKKTLISAMPGGTSIGEAPLDGAVYSRQGSSASWVIAGGFPDGDKGDITITSSGTVWTIDADAVTFAKMQNIATDSLIGRDTAGTGDPENITLGTSLSMSGAQVLQRAALTGDVTATVDSNATTIANSAVTLAKMANLTAPVLVGRTTAGAGVPEALTPTQATAMLDVFASSLKGLVPSPAGATATFLKADGTWAAPSDSTKVLKAGDTMTGDLTISKATPYFSLSRTDSTTEAAIWGMVGGVRRWKLTLGTNEVETGGNIGSNFNLVARNDDGTQRFVVLQADRVSGLISVAGDPTAALGVATKQYVDATFRGHIAGLTLSAVGSSATFGIAPGVATDSTNAAMMTQVSAYTKTTAAWAVGTGNGSLDAGSIAASTWYHVHLIKRIDTGVVDVLVSLSATTPTLPTSYTLFRRIGAMKTNGSSQWITFIQNGDKFEWEVPVSDVSSASNFGSSAISRTLTVPPGIIVEAFGSVSINDVAGNLVLLSNLALADQAPGLNGSNIGMGNPPSGNLRSTGSWSCFTNTAQQIRSRTTSGSASTLLDIGTRGWIDTRGRFL